MSEMTVGSIHTTVIPQQSGIYEALREKAERERDEANEELHKKYVEYDKLFDEAEKIRKERDEARKEKEKWGLHAEKVERECDHYKQALEEVSSSIDDWLNSLIQEPSLDFIKAIKAWADKKLKEI